MEYKKPKSVLFVGGGSLGHIIPSLAVHEVLTKLQPNIHTHFVCSSSKLEKDFLENSKCLYTSVNPAKLNIWFPFKIQNAIFQADTILEKEKPDVVFSKGGYVSIPICIAAKRKNIPIILHESDAVFGRANKWIAHSATKICTGFTMPNLSQKILQKTTHTGNPIRECVTKGSREEALKITGLEGKKPILLVMGGSQGSLALNKAVTDQIDTLLQHFEIIHITGQGKNIVEKRKNYYSCEFAFDILPHFFAATDIALSRAGGNATAELFANNIPCVLVPLRNVGHDHQQKNAMALSKLNQCVVLQQSNIDDKLHTTLLDLIKNKQILTDDKGMPRNMNKTAAMNITEIILEVLASSSKSH